MTVGVFGVAVGVQELVLLVREDAVVLHSEPPIVGLDREDFLLCLLFGQLLVGRWVGQVFIEGFRDVHSSLHNRWSQILVSWEDDVVGRVSDGLQQCGLMPKQVGADDSPSELGLDSGEEVVYSVAELCFDKFLRRFPFGADVEPRIKVRVII